MPAGGACLLGSLNLSEFITDNKEFDYSNSIGICFIASCIEISLTLSIPNESNIPFISAILSIIQVNMHVYT